MWLAGGGVKGGVVHGETDEFGYHAVRDKVQMHDLHATMLHLLGFDHTKLTFRFGGRDMRLTDVHGELVEKILRGCTANLNSITDSTQSFRSHSWPARIHPASRIVVISHAHNGPILEPMFPPNTGRGRRQQHSIKDIIDAIFYINANGCKWRDLPHDFPPYTSVSHHYTKWMRDGTWRRVNDALRAAVREEAGREPHPSAGAVDSQTTKAAPTGGHRGTTGARKPWAASVTSWSIPSSA